MTTLVAVGAQWGDEGKGKIVDWLAPKAQLVVRFHGGNNAGHTLVVDGEQTVLHVVPAGVLDPDTLNLIGPGVVVDPDILLEELDALTARGVLRDPSRVRVSGRAHVLTCTVNHQPWIPGIPLPYTIAIVEIVEQKSLRLMTNIVGCAPEEVRIGMPVRVTFEAHDDVYIPLFEPEDG